MTNDGHSSRQRSIIKKCQEIECGKSHIRDKSTKTGFKSVSNYCLVTINLGHVSSRACSTKTNSIIIVSFQLLYRKSSQQLRPISEKGKRRRKNLHSAYHTLLTFIFVPQTYFRVPSRVRHLSVIKKWCGTFPGINQWERPPRTKF